MHNTRYRSFESGPCQVRAVNGATVIEGHAAVFDVLSEPLHELGGARERISPGAFARAIQDGDDVKALQNHNADLVLGRTKSGTLTLKEDDQGLWFSVALPSTSYARDLVESMRRGDINQNSFGFSVDDQIWEKQDGESVSVIRSVRLFEISVGVPFPAYSETFSQVRSITEALTRDNPSPEEQARIKEFAERCHKKACPPEVSRTEGQPAGCSCQRKHETEPDVDVAVAREIRRREIELFEIDA